MKCVIGILGVFLGLTVNVFAQDAGKSSSQSECSPPLGACKVPVKWIAEKNDCSCFACEYGKPTQHTGCTSDKQAKASLLKLQNSGDEQEATAAPLMILKGTIVADGDKVSFVNDKDAKTWEITNPEGLKGHEGHHVQLSAHVYADKDSIHVMSVKMVK